MEAGEIRHRGKQAVRVWLESRGLGLVRPVTPAGRSGAPWVSPLPRAFDVDRYADVADRLLEGRYSLFALDDVVLGFPPVWNRDPRTGVEAPTAFGKSINYRDPRVCGDAKYLWELNRHAMIVALAQAWHLTGQQRYAEGCRTILESWFTQCPYPYGMNWSSSLELAIRITNWSFAWHLLGSDDAQVFDGAAGRTFKTAWRQAARQHCGFIAGNLSEFSSANNHLIGELMGLFIASVTWPAWDECEAWRELARQRLELEIQKQLWSDGVSKEQSTWYHQAVADMMLLVLLYGRANGYTFSQAFDDRLLAMLEFVAGIMDVAGHVPAYGDADDAVIGRVAPADNSSVYRSALATGAVIYDRADFARKAGTADDSTRWLLGDSVDARLAALGARPSPASARRVFPDAGYYVLGKSLDTNREIRVVADAGPLGYLSIAAHGHADALSFTLNAGGRELLIDPGTYAYHTEPEWRAYFRGTAAHNTVRVDGRDQSVTGGSFMWLRHANAWAETVDFEADTERLIAWQDGYSRLRDPVRHRREWVLDRERQSLVVTDELFCRRPHRVEMFWHFSEACTVSCSGDRAIARNGSVILTMALPSSFQAALLEGTTSPIGGWRSTALDRKRPCPTIVLTGQIDSDSRLVTEFRIDFDDD